MSCQPIPNKIRLGVNVDHVATLRQARYREMLNHPNAEPCPIQAAREAESAGASGITAHLRSDRRHMQDADLFALRKAVRTKLNLEMGLTEEILQFALTLLPDDVCIVPENRNEVTTEGGLDCIASQSLLRAAIPQLRKAGIHVSLFIDPIPDQIRAAADLGAEFIELHTGCYANATDPNEKSAELQRLYEAAKLAQNYGLRINAGHGLNYQNVAPICKIPGIEELNIGHSIVSRAIFIGMADAVRQMLDIIHSAS
ncbi:MAG: pyridoxine 5'-phosphate synthase [Chthoniobacterales bacterium]|nr:pyridoxine 5'-phosphate synthase [Chthoniobacterales bacterium]